MKRIKRKVSQKSQKSHAKNDMTNLTKLTKLTRKFVKMVNLVMQKNDMRIVRNLRILSHKGTIFSQNSHFSQSKKLMSDTIRRNEHRNNKNNL